MRLVYGTGFLIESILPSLNNKIILHQPDDWNKK